jgi:hypothetical protein
MQNETEQPRGLARAGVDQAVAAVNQTAELAVKALDIGTGTAVDAVRTLATIATSTGGRVVDTSGKVADTVLAEIEEERGDLIEQIRGFQQRTTERLGDLAGSAADALPGPL